MVRPKRQKVRLIRKQDIKVSKMPFLRLKPIGKFLIVLVIVGGIGAFLIRVKDMLVDSEQFVVKGIEIKLYDEKGFLRNISVDEDVGREIIGTNIFFVDLEGLKERMQSAHPEFKEVILRRFLPNKLIARAHLRKAIGQVRSDRYYPIDEEGIVLPDIKNFPEPDLPIITGLGINLAKNQMAGFTGFEKERIGKALALMREIKGIKELSSYKLKVIDATDPGNLTFFFDIFNVEIKIGSSDFNNRLKMLATVIDQLGEDINKFKYIDLRFEDPIVGPG
jgi:cell division septal protein FtsQ